MNGTGKKKKNDVDRIAGLMGELFGQNPPGIPNIDEFMRDARRSRH